MNILNELDKKIDELKSLANNDRDRILLDEEKKIVLECIEALKNDEVFYNYDFGSIINILNMENITIEDIDRYIKEIKETIEIRKIIFTQNFSPKQVNARNELTSEVNNLNRSLDERIDALNQNVGLKEEVVNLEDMRNILNNTGKKKYYDEKMFEAFYKQFDWENMSDEDFKSTIELFKNTRNFQGKVSKKTENFDDVINLFKEFFNEKEFDVNSKFKYDGLMYKFIKKYSAEICASIDLENAREILSFFKEKGILDEFERQSIVKICTFAESDYVMKLYEDIMKNNPDFLEMYFTDSFTKTWINTESSVRRSKFRTTKSGNDSEEKTLYSSCQGVNNEEVKENIKLLKKYNYLFSDKYDMSNIGAHLRVLTMPNSELKEELANLNYLISSHTWALKKNLNLLEEFNIGSVPVSALTKGDLENKIHLAVELGLLNPPMSDVFRKVDKDIITNERFLSLKSQANISNNTIRNYFARNVAVLASLDINRFGFLFYRLRDLGYTDFYNYFFHETRTGTRATAQIEEDMKRNMKDKDAFILENFISDVYDKYIGNKYNEYDVVISNYNEDSKKQNGNFEYYDDSILEDDLIRKLEENYRVIDVLNSGDETVDNKNEFLYKFDDVLISRLKVLKNASILKKRYGYLNQDMLLSSIVRNSFITEDAFNKIKESVEERNVLL